MEGFDCRGCAFGVEGFSAYRRNCAREVALFHRAVADNDNVVEDVGVRFHLHVNVGFRADFDGEWLVADVGEL